MARVLLVPCGRLDREVYRELGDRLAARLSVEVAHVKTSLDPGPAYDPSRNQYCSTVLLTALLTQYPIADGERLVGVTGEDLFIPILTFVFGEALLDGPACILSLARLRPSFYGLPEDRGLLLDRAAKEALHEIGHTYGLTHCRHPDCVMRASTSADEVDLKPAWYCRSCAPSLPPRRGRRPQDRRGRP